MPNTPFNPVKGLVPALIMWLGGTIAFAVLPEDAAICVNGCLALALIVAK